MPASHAAPECMVYQIRRVEPDDFMAVKRLFESISVIANTTQLPYPSLEMWRQRLANESNDRYTLVACAEQEIVGYLGLNCNQQPRRRHIGGLGIMIAEQWQGKGVGSALLGATIDLADNWLNLKRLELTVYSDNKQAIGLYKKFGFVEEGVHRADAFRNGEYVDSLCMARVRL